MEGVVSGGCGTGGCGSTVMLYIIVCTLRA